MRLFAAVELRAEARSAIAERLDAARPWFPNAAWVRPGNLHLTLAFFGETAEQALAGLVAAIEPAVTPIEPLRARLGGAGAFPERGPIRVVWLGIEPAAGLARLAEAVRAAARSAGVEFDDKPFRSHVTLARCRRRWPAALRARLDELAGGGESVEVPVGSVALLASEQAAGGSRYTRQAELALGGDPERPATSGHR